MARRRDWALCGLAALAAALVPSLPPVAGRLEGPGIDALLWLRHAILGVQRRAADAPVAIVAIDEETYRRPPFQDVPQVLWTPQLARVLDAVVAGGAAVVGFDVILSTSVERFMPGHDRPFLVALRRASEQGRVVLGKVQHGQQPLRPFPGQSFAVGHERNIRALNLFQDPDGVIRRAPLLFASEDLRAGSRRDPAMALELALRVSGAPLALDAAGRPLWRGRALPGDPARGLLLNFEAGHGAIPAFSLADLHACAEAGDAAFFARHFAGRAVLLGAMLDVEDRKLTSMRYVTAPGSGDWAPRCRLQRMTDIERTDVARDTVPGVLVHATAVDNLLRGAWLEPLPPAAAAGALLALAALVAAATLLLPSAWAGAAAMAAVAAAWAAGGAFALASGTALPLYGGGLAAALAWLLTLLLRFAITDRDRRRLRQVFGLYLAPSIVDRLAAADRLPALGGERRVLTFMFTDIAGFARIGEALDPATLAALLNDYFDGLCDTVMRHGGMVNEFIGDSVLAFFGAPQDQPDHAARALACARDADAYAEGFRAARLALGIGAGTGFGHTRIGVHTGPALVGNFGARQRLKYAALGDTVNTASRVEGLNKFFGTRACVTGATLAAAGAVPGLLTRPLGSVVVKGRQQALDVHELLAPDAIAPDRLARYRDAYALMAAADARAPAAFAALADEDPQDGPSAFHRDRLAAGARDAVVVMEEK